MTKTVLYLIDAEKYFEGVIFTVKDSVDCNG